MDDLQAKNSTNELTQLTAEIVSAFIANNRVDPSELIELIASTHRALSKLNAREPKAPEALIPPVSIKKSLTAEYLISLEDGKRYKSLKRHLSGRGLTPADYKAKWGLPNDYPMVAPNYAKQRSDLAKQLGLGQQRRGQKKEDEVEAPAPEPEVAKAVAVKRAPKKAAAEAAQPNAGLPDVPDGS